MSKGLETLKEIGEEVIKVTCLAGWVEETTKEAYGKRFDEIERELKALEIIKKKNVIIHDIRFFSEYVREGGQYGSPLKCYNFGKPISEELTQDEFDLLKEVLK